MVGGASSQTGLHTSTTDFGRSATATYTCADGASKRSNEADQRHAGQKLRGETGCITGVGGTRSGIHLLLGLCDTFSVAFGFRFQALVICLVELRFGRFFRYFRGFPPTGASQKRTPKPYLVANDCFKGKRNGELHGRRYQSDKIERPL